MRNICSLRLERSCSEMEKLEGELSFPRENFHFPRSDGCLTEHSEVRQSRSRKGKFASRNGKFPEIFPLEDYSLFSHRDAFFLSVAP